MDQQVVIPSRFCGPPESGNGGYSCGLVAEFIDAPTVEVTLHAPPPLDRPLRVARAEGEVRLMDAETLIAVGRSVDGPISADGAVVDSRAAALATERFDELDYRRSHDFPMCFTCGPDRAAGDGLRIFPAATDRPDVCVWSWSPPAGLFEDGSLDTKLTWAALDCPSGQAWLSMDPDLGAVVLGRMTATVFRSPVPGETLTVVGCADTAKGRRRFAQSALWSTDGELLAAADTTWVQLSDEQRAAFGS